MKNEIRFNNAINKLVRAFFDDTLMKGDCSACAVGNIVNNNTQWAMVFCVRDGNQRIIPENYYGEARKVIDSSGYTWQELSLIEKAFEFNTSIPSRSYSRYSRQQIMKDQYRGLMAVVDVLCEIESTEADKYKKMFEYNEQIYLQTKSNYKDNGIYEDNETDD